VSYIDDYQYSFTEEPMSNQIIQEGQGQEGLGQEGLGQEGLGQALPLLINANACCGDDCCGGSKTMSNGQNNQPQQEQTMLVKEGKITEAVREHYGAIAASVLVDETSQAQADCCGTSCCSSDLDGNTISSGLYTVDELEGLPLKAALGSLGCGNPTALAELHEGETVLDLGSGGGIDVLLSARRVGATGFAYGLDMTDEMLSLAQRNKEEAGVQNVAFLKGDIADIPLPDNSVDVIISNCVINLAADKTPVLREAFRVLKPGGRFAVSDIVIHGGLPQFLQDSAALRRDLSSWAGCIAGALTDKEYRTGLAEAGFSDIDLEITRRYQLEDLPQPLPNWVMKLAAPLANKVVSRFSGTFVRARKPSELVG